MKVIIYHNPKCSKSRAAMTLLEEKALKPEVVLYLKEEITFDNLKSVFVKLNGSILDMIRFKEKLANELSISKNDDRSDDEWLKILVANPSLIERPIVIVDNKAAIGRPIENIKAIL